MHRFRLVAGLVLWAWPQLANAGPPVAVVADVVENASDGFERRGCGLQVSLEIDAKRKFWISFGAVGPAKDVPWRAFGPRVHCGLGAFDEASAGFEGRFGTPYGIFDFEILARADGNDAITLETSWSERRLSAYDGKGNPVYARGKDVRAFDREALLPLLVSDPRESEAFGVRELVLRLTAKRLGREPAAAYGEISVATDVANAAIFLDGGFVARSTEREVRLRNVPVGKREVVVRDLSNREDTARVEVEEGRTAQVVASLLKLPRDSAASEWLPIGENPQGFSEYWRRRDAALVVEVPEGEFTMGSAEGEGGADEHPQRTVHVSRFRIDKLEVTWRQFRRFLEAKPLAPPAAPPWGMREDYPATNVVWEEAKAYCEWVGGRLPTEAQWEKAARGSDGRKFPWGNDWDPERCNSWEGGPHRPASAGSHPRCVSPYGVYDMAGNVWEWCADFYAERAYAEGASRDPRGPATGDTRVLRGGYWNNHPDLVRAAHRYKTASDYRNMNYGFRCVHDVVPER